MIDNAVISKLLNYFADIFNILLEADTIASFKQDDVFKFTADFKFENDGSVIKKVTMFNPNLVSNDKL